jgi:hypothetical protein
MISAESSRPISMQLSNSAFHKYEDKTAWRLSRSNLESLLGSFTAFVSISHCMDSLTLSRSMIRMFPTGQCLGSEHFLLVL